MGDAPLIASDGFTGVTATVYYSANNATWTEENFQNYGGTLTWQADASLPGSTSSGVLRVDGGTCGENLTWELNSKGTVTISGTGEMTSAPWKTDYSTVIKKVVIEEGITNVYNGAFSYCSSLAEVELPSSLITLGSNAFSFCSALKEVVLPENLEVIGYDAFWNAGLVSINIPTSVHTVTGDALDMDSLQNVYVEDLSHWFNLHFDNCDISYDNLYLNGELVTDLVIPSDITSIAYSAFDGMTCLESVTIPESVTSIGQYAFYGCTNLKEVHIPNSVTAINANTFSNCESLTSLTLPASVLVINSNAFAPGWNSFCALEELIFMGDAPLIASDGFTGVTATVYYSANNATWTEAFFQNYGGELTWVGLDELPGTGNEEIVYIIASGTCGGNVYWQLDSRGVLTVSAGQAARSADVSYAMDNYENPEDAPWYAYRAQINSVVVESSVESVGSNAFTACENLSSVTIGEGVETIGENAFAECESLTEVVFQGNAPEMGENCFANVEATLYHPVDNETWTEEVVESTGGQMIMEAVDFSMVYGDVNLDGEIDILDANLVVAWYNEIRELEDDQLLAADVNGDGEVDIMDANMIVAYYNEVIDAFPAK